MSIQKLFEMIKEDSNAARLTRIYNAINILSDRHQRLRSRKKLTANEQNEVWALEQVAAMLSADFNDISAKLFKR